ncbi:DNA internalization-related competence protein ComEC/Rec2 [Azohydromonas lata]|uniref:DNA internalization-related competence protein ComEC/Rec2 n=1 Tax=Azohydromonas lata TaxID=45677 RepID=A0ABU5IAB7_9BURK|nr:DNA internalization-related competence protein ComEC/Rec2 [Azohydromonas lata]MDZ5455595.1 DNA internalization-related competence protein ComEC/Rec2 [Azohydromonas lata]
MSLLALALAWLLGTAWQLQQPRLWAPVVDAALLLGAPLLWLSWRWARSSRLVGRWRLLFMALALGGAAALGAANAGLQARARLADALPPALERQAVELTGVVAELPQDSAEGLRFVLAVEGARTPDGAPAAVPSRVSLSWSRSGPDEPALSSPGVELRAGQRWRLWARLQAPHALLNPHGFDGELWLFERGLRATGSVRGEPAQPRLLAEGQCCDVERARQSVREAIAAQVSNPRAAGVLAALAVGDQAAIERADWSLYRASGTAHLMAISGLHITMFAWLAAQAVGALWRRSAALCLWLPTPWAARALGVLLAAAYALLAGWGVPSQRTVWMLGCAALLHLLGARWPWPLVLGAAAVVVSALDPWALLQAGFWLSFAAVGLLMVSEPAQPAAVARVDIDADAPPGPARRALALLRGAVRTQLVATVGLAPLTLLLFQQFSVVGLLANLVAIPLVTLAVTPLALLGVLWAPLWSVAAVLLLALNAVLAWLVGLPGAVWITGVAPGWAQWAALLAGVLAVAPLPWRLRLLAVPLLLPVALPPPSRPAPGFFEVVAADVGQGNAVLVRTHASVLVYDSGPRYGPGRDAGERVLVPLLQALGERQVDTLVISHRDMDHAGGAASLLRALPVGELRSSLEAGHALLAVGVAHQRCEAGQRWERDGVRFAVLHPRASDYAVANARPNALSCVLQVTDAAGRRLLLSGDIGAAQEAALVAADAAALRSALLLVPHHGSGGSSSPAFLDAVAPEVAIVQAGHHNRFGHPAPDVVQRLRDRGIEMVQTPDCGAWRWRDGQSSCERLLRPRYWRHGLS